MTVNALAARSLPQEQPGWRSCQSSPQFQARKGQAWASPRNCLPILNYLGSCKMEEEGEQSKQTDRHTDMHVKTHMHAHTRFIHRHPHRNTHTHGTPSCQYSMCSNMESLTAGQLLPRMSEWSSALSSVDVHRQMLFCLCLEVRLAGCCWDHANLPVKKFYKIGFTHQICGASVSWCPHDSIESSGLSCPLRCQLHRTSALQVEIAGMQMILYLPYNILSALLYLSQFT